MTHLPKNRRPAYPGEVFLDEFLIPLSIMQILIPPTSDAA